MQNGWRWQRHPDLRGHPANPHLKEPRCGAPSTQVTKQQMWATRPTYPRVSVKAPSSLARRAVTRWPPAWLRPDSLPIWSCSVWGLPCRDCYQPRGGLLPRRFTLTDPFDYAQGQAVCFLLHWPSSRLAPTVPDVIRHTALRSSDFPPPPDRLAPTGGSDHPAACT